MKKGKVYLVGAGPGQADLITVRGAELLKAAHCIIYDKLANPALLKFASPDAEIIHVPKRVGPGSSTQEQINKLLIEKVAVGKTVVRLKGGDPCIFARGAEEAELLAEAGIDFEIVPGVTAAIAAAEYSGIMLTHRDYSSQVAFITGHEAEGKTDTNIDWRLLAQFPGTIVFYMAMANLQFIADQLIKNGAKADTPVAVIADATLPTQTIAKASLLEIADECTQKKIEPPAIVVIGAAADSSDKLNWFMKKPLFGKSIVLTRDAHGNADFAAKIIARAGDPIQFPTIKLQPLTNTNQFLQTLADFSQYHWIVFTSSNGVGIFFDALQDLGKDSRVFASAKIAAIGPQTAAKLAEFGIKTDLVPNVFTGKDLAAQLIAAANLKNKKVLLLRSQAASTELPHLLRQADAQVDDVPIYTTQPIKADPEKLKNDIAGGAVHWLTFASPSAVRFFFQQIHADLVNSSDVKVASIGPVTSDELKSAGVKVVVEASVHTLDELLDAIEGIYR